MPAGPVGRSSSVCRAPGQVSTVLGEEVVALVPATNLFFTINTVGSRIWELIDGPSPVPVTSLVDSLVAEFKVDADTCTAEVLVFLERLRGLGLVATV